MQKTNQACSEFKVCLKRNGISDTGRQQTTRVGEKKEGRRNRIHGRAGLWDTHTVHKMGHVRIDVGNWPDDVGDVFAQSTAGLVPQAGRWR